MFRYLILPTLLCVILVSDWANAFGRRCRPAPKPVSCPAPVYYQPVYQQPVYQSATVACPPVVAVPKKDVPKVVPERMDPPKTKIDTPVKPEVKPEIKSETPKKKPDDVITLPPGAFNDEKLPPTKVPPVPSTKVDIVPVESKTVPSTPLASPKAIEPDPLPTTPPATPVPVPVTPVTPELPKLELPKLEIPKVEPETSKSTLPKIEVPDLAIPKIIEPRESKSSPLNAEVKTLKIEQFPVDGKIPTSPDAKRTVTFYNFTGRDLLLTIDGKMVMLTNKYCVAAEVTPAFRWQIGADTERDAKVPVTAPGMEIVIR